MEKPRRKARKYRGDPEDFSSQPKPKRETIWLSDKIPKEKLDPERHFSVMSYNMLAQAYTKHDGFPYVEHLYLTARYRFTSLIVELSTISPDIACFQEMDKYDDVWAKEMKKLGYDGLWKKRCGRKKDGCGIFWKNQFRLVDSAEVEFNVLRDQYGIITQRDNVALFVCLQTNTGEKFCVGTVHTFWNPEYEWIKLLQVRMYITELHRFAKGLPIIATGDFNSQPDSAVYAEITGGKCDYTVRMPVVQAPPSPPSASPPQIQSTLESKAAKEDEENEENEEVEKGKYLTISDDDDTPLPTQALAPEKLPIQLSSAYARYGPTGHPPFTNFKQDFQGVLDYIFYDSSSIEVLSCLSLPTRAKITPEIALPSSIYPSDHLSIVATFALLNKP